METAVPPAWLAAFPGSRFLPEWRLMIWGPHGLLNAAMLDSSLHWIEAIEPTLGTFNRCIDLSDIAEVHLRTDEVAACAARRRERYAGEPVTSVFLAPSPLAYGMARMYEHLMSGAPIHVHVAVRITSAAAILGVPVDVLTRRG